MDFRRADLGCVQWCQIGLGKEVVATTPFISDRGSFPQKDLKSSLLAAQNLAGCDPATNFRSTTKDNEGKNLGSKIYFNKML